MTSFTPGPWTTDCTDGDGFAYVGSKAALVAIVQQDLLGSPPEAVARANARLIAAAPRLLSCLKEAIASWELADEDADAEPEDGDPLAEWKAAVAAAESAPTVDVQASRVTPENAPPGATCPIHDVPTVDSKGRPNAHGLGACLPDFSKESRG